MSTNVAVKISSARCDEREVTRALRDEATTTKLGCLHAETRRPKRLSHKPWLPLEMSILTVCILRLRCSNKHKFPQSSIDSQPETDRSTQIFRKSKLRRITRTPSYDDNGHPRFRRDLEVPRPCRADQLDPACNRALNWSSRDQKPSRYQSQYCSHHDGKKPSSKLMNPA